MEVKRFRKGLLGFRKNDVYEHIENLYKQFEDQLREKDEIINQLNKQNSLLKQQLDEQKDRFNGIEDYKSNIADVLIKAKEQGQEIIREAEKDAQKVKEEMDKIIDGERGKLELFRSEIDGLKQQSIILLEKYKEELQNIIDTKFEKL